MWRRHRTWRPLSCAPSAPHAAEIFSMACTAAHQQPLRRCGAPAPGRAQAPRREGSSWRRAGSSRALGSRWALCGCSVLAAMWDMIAVHAICRRGEHCGGASPASAAFRSPCAGHAGRSAGPWAPLQHPASATGPCMGDAHTGRPARRRAAQPVNSHPEPYTHGLRKRSVHRVRASLTFMTLMYCAGVAGVAGISHGRVGGAGAGHRAQHITVRWV